MAKKTKIYTLFLLAGEDLMVIKNSKDQAMNLVENFRKYHPDIKISENQEMLERIKDESKNVEFVGEMKSVRAEDIIPIINEQKDDLDGLLVFGSPSDEMISVGLPIVAVEQPLLRCSTVPFQAYKDSKVVTSFLPKYCDKNPKTYPARIKDIVRKIKLIDIISKMKNLRILAITDKPPLGYFEPWPYQIETTREDYDKIYVKNLEETFGSKIVAIQQEELFKKVETADEKEAKELTYKWIKSSVGLRGTNEAEVLKSEKLYLAMKELMEEYNCNAITTEGYGWPPLGWEKTDEIGIASQGLPATQFCTDGIVAVSETLMDCLITQQIGLYLTGSTGLLGDYTIDPFINTAIVAHCEGTIKPYGDERRIPYSIRNLPFFLEENIGGACVQPHYPIHEPVTVVKISMYQKKMSIFTGETLPGEELFPYWDDLLGRSKVAIKTNTKELLENVDWKLFGNHRTVYFGNYRQDFKDLAKLIGYEILEEDKQK